MHEVFVCNRLLGEAFDNWADASADAKAARQAAFIADLQQRLAMAQAESSRLAADNARYTRLIDNPDWGKFVRQQTAAGMCATPTVYAIGPLPCLHLCQGWRLQAL